jgi:glucose dehydrogenase
MAAEACIECDVAIVGAGFAGALIANELGKARKKVVVLEAGDPVPPNINDFMRRFYMAPAKVPESPYTPEIFDAAGNLSDPSKMNAGRPTVLSLLRKGGFGDWTDPKQSYLIQKGPRPFASTYDRIAGGTAHWLGTCLRFVPADFKMKTNYPSVPQFVDWPIGYDDLNDWYGKAEEELGVSADLEEQKYLGIQFPANYKYPMPKIPNSLVDLAVADALKSLSEDETKFLEMERPPTEIRVRNLPAARNSQPYKNRRACAGNTNCIPICPIQAKYDPTMTLNDATNTGFVQLMDRTVASDIVVGENGRISQINFIRHAGPRTSGCENLCCRGKRYRNSTAAVDVEKRRPDRQWRCEQQRHGRAQPDGSSLLRCLGFDAEAGISISRPADHVGHRGFMRWTVPRQTGCVPYRYRQ